MSFDIYQKRLQSRGITEADRMARAKLDSFKYGLIHAYNSEKIVKDGIESLALVSDDKVTMDTDQKNISAEWSTGYKVGDTLHWKRTDTYWVVISQHLTERAYFKADMKKALYKIKWRDEQNTIHEQWASVLGPTETRINTQDKKGVSFDVPNNSLTLWLGACDGATSLQRYKQIYLAGKVWEIASVDNITTPSLVKIHMSESLVDKDRDNVVEGIPRDEENMIVEIDSRVITGLDKVSPIIGLTQTYTIDVADALGTWSVDPKFGSITVQDNTSATVKFTGQSGLTQISYSISGAVVASMTIKIASLLG